MNTDISIRIDRVLDFYDVPQLFTARDAFDTLYLCLLYEDSPECRYTAIRISGRKLDCFLTGKTDLRELFLHPETPDEYFEVSVHDKLFKISGKVNAPIPEARLPQEGYTAYAEEKESVVIHIPAADKGLLKELVRKFGWACM